MNIETQCSSCPTDNSQSQGLMLFETATGKVAEALAADVLVFRPSADVVGMMLPSEKVSRSLGWLLLYKGIRQVGQSRFLSSHFLKHWWPN